MAVEHEYIQERRYLLGSASENEREALEQDYFSNPDALERVEVAEEDLIEAYLAGELTPADHERFEGDYLKSPAHQQRVELVRALQTLMAARASRAQARAPQDAAPQSAVTAPAAVLPMRSRPQPRRPGTWWAAAGALAAAAVLFVAVWFGSGRETGPNAPQSASVETAQPAAPAAQADRPPAAAPPTGTRSATPPSATPPSATPPSATPPSATPPSTTPPSATPAAAPAPGPAAAPAPALPSAAPRVFAFTLTPMTVRSGGESPALVIPPNTDLVQLTLEGDETFDATPPSDARISIRTPADDEVWRGAATAVAGRAATVRASVPARRLRPDDYIVVLTGAHRELGRYVLRVRAR